MRLDEPAADLGICMALISSLEETPLEKDTVYIGEVGLTGELRSVQRIQERIKEAERLGFKKAILPTSKELLTKTKLAIKQVKRIQELI